MVSVKQGLAAAIAVGLSFVALAATNVFGSDASPERGRSDPFAEVTTPTGPEVSLEGVTALAQAEAKRAGEPNPTLSLGKGTLKQAMGTFDASFYVPEPVTDPGYQRLLETPVDLVVMTGERFTLADAPVRPGSQLPSGTALFLVIDSHRGVVMGRGLPTLEELAHAEAVSAAHAASSRAISFAVVRGTITGVLIVAGGPPKHKSSTHQPTHAVIIKKGSRTVTIALTNHKGRFLVLLRPGTYTLKGTVGSDCKQATATVRAGETTHVKLVCSIF